MSENISSVGQESSQLREKPQHTVNPQAAPWASVPAQPSEAWFLHLLGPETIHCIALLSGIVNFKKFWNKLLHIFHFSGWLTQSACIKFFLHTVTLLSIGYLGSIISVPKDIKTQTSFISFCF